MTERVVVNHESEVPPMKRIGIIGGMGQWATLDILGRIFKASVNYPVPQYGNRGYPPIDLRMMNKAPMKLNPDGSYPEKLEPSDEFLDAARFVGMNSDFLIITSNTAHIFAKEAQDAAGKPLLSLIDVAVDEAKRRNCKRVGLMTIGLTLKKNLFQDLLSEHGIEPVILAEGLGKRLEDEGIYPVQEGANPSSHRESALEVLNYLRAQKVDGIILGCTEIPLLLGDAVNETDIINPSQLVAEAVIRKCLE